MRNAETKERRMQKIKFLQETFPNIKSINVVSDIAMYNKIKQAIFEAGFYQTKNINLINDQTVFRLIQEAKGIKAYQQIAKNNIKGLKYEKIRKQQ